jgi:hypothetical protein
MRSSLYSHLIQLQNKNYYLWTINMVVHKLNYACLLQCVLVIDFVYMKNLREVFSLDVFYCTALKLAKLSIFTISFLQWIFYTYRWRTYMNLGKNQSVDLFYFRILIPAKFSIFTITFLHCISYTQVVFDRRRLYAGCMMSIGSLYVHVKICQAFW